MKLFRQVATRPNVTVERFFLPHCSRFAFGAIDFARGKRFQRTHQLCQRPECRIFMRSFVFWPGLKKSVHMIRHDADGEEFVTRIVETTPRVQHNVPSLRIKAAATRRRYCHRVNCPGLFKIWEPTTRVKSARCRFTLEKSSRWQNAIASTLQACAPRIFIPRKQRQGTTFFLPCRCS